MITQTVSQEKSWNHYVKARNILIQDRVGLVEVHNAMSQIPVVIVATYDI